jgi:hypothetical protein
VNQQPIPGETDPLRRLDTFVGVALRVARSARTGQALLASIASAIEPEWVPTAVAAELEAAAALALQPIEFRHVELILREAWGTAATDELDDLDPDPVAITPIAQVHRGLLAGAPVAVKVLRPGLAPLARQDLSLLRALVAPLAAAFPALDAAATLAEVRERLLDELDLEHEAAIQRRLHRALQGHPSLSVPAPVMRLAHENVLVSEWVDGVPLSNARDHDRVAAELVAFALGAARSGIVHAGLDPDDVLVVPGGGLAVLDFGAARVIDGERAAAAGDALAAFAARDTTALANLLARHEWAAPRDGIAARQAQRIIELGHRALGPLVGPGSATLDGEALLAVHARLAGQRRDLADLLDAGTLPPEDVWPLLGIARLIGTIARIGATAQWLPLAIGALRDGWGATARRSGGPAHR